MLCFRILRQCRSHLYLHAFRLVYRKAGGAEFSAAYVARDASGAPFRRRGQSALLIRILRNDRFRLRLDFVLFILVPVAAKIQRHWLLDGFWYRRHRGSRFRCCRRRWNILDFLTALWMTVESLRLIRTSAGLAGLRSAFRRRGGEYFQIIR